MTQVQSELSDPIEIRALQRGLALLETVNQNNGARLRDIVELCGLPKTTTHRILENLRSAGYLTRRAGSDRYYLTVEVRRLSDGFFDGGWISAIARPVLKRLSDSVGYPVGIATPYGTSMMVRDNTDSDRPLIPDKVARGTLIPLFTSASGKVYLAFCDEMTRKTLIEVCAASDKPEHDFARHPRLLSQMIGQVRKQRFAFGFGEQRVATAIKTSTCAVPVIVKDAMIGCLAIRYIDEHLSRKRVVEKYLPALEQHAELIVSQVARSAALKRGSIDSDIQLINQRL